MDVNEALWVEPLFKEYMLDDFEASIIFLYDGVMQAKLKFCAVSPSFSSAIHFTYRIAEHMSVMLPGSCSSVNIRNDFDKSFFAIDVHVALSKQHTENPEGLLFAIKPLRMYASLLNFLEVAEFGSYPYGKEGKKAPVEWIIYEKDTENNYARLIAKDCLDFLPLDNDRRYTDIRLCSLYEWLNTDFLETAFSEKERDSIISIYPEGVERICSFQEKVSLPSKDIYAKINSRTKNLLVSAKLSEYAEEKAGDDLTYRRDAHWLFNPCWGKSRKKQSFLDTDNTCNAIDHRGELIEISSSSRSGVRPVITVFADHISCFADSRISGKAKKVPKTQEVPK